MPFNRFVETGRVALISEGDQKGKLVSIVDVIDQTRVLVDGPSHKVPRREIRLNQLHLTKFRIKFPYTASTRVVRKAWAGANIDEKWKESMWAKKLEAKEKRAELSDFDRFKLRKARQRRNRVRTHFFYKFRKAAARDGTLYGKNKVKKSNLKRKPTQKERRANREKREEVKAKEVKAKEPKAEEAKTSKAPKAKAAKTPAKK